MSAALGLLVEGCARPLLAVELPVAKDEGTLLVSRVVGEQLTHEVFDLAAGPPVWTVESDTVRFEVAHYSGSPSSLGLSPGPHVPPPPEYLTRAVPPPERVWAGTYQQHEFGGWTELRVADAIARGLRVAVGPPCAPLVATPLPTEQLGAPASPRFVGELDGEVWVDTQRAGAPLYTYDGVRFSPRVALPAAAVAIHGRGSIVELLTEDGRLWSGDLGSTFTATSAPGWPAGARIVAAATGFGDTWAVARDATDGESMYLYRRDGAWETFARVPSPESDAHCLAIAPERGICVVAEDVSSPTVREANGRTRRYPVELGPLVTALGGLGLAPSGAVLLGGPGGRVLALEPDGWRELASPAPKGIAKFVGLILPFGERVMLVSVTEFAEYDDTVEASCPATTVVATRLTVARGIAWRGGVLVSADTMLKLAADR